MILLRVNLKLTGVRHRAKNAVVRPVERRVGMFGFCVISAGRGLA
jgi:hypothetical protein